MDRLTSRAAEEARAGCEKANEAYRELEAGRWLLNHVCPEIFQGTRPRQPMELQSVTDCGPVPGDPTKRLIVQVWVRRA